LKQDTFERVRAFDLAGRPLTPYFLLDADELLGQLTRFERAFPGAEIAYAIKANAEAEVIECLARTSITFEVASWHEIELLLNHRIDPERMVYGTAVKPRSHVEAAAGAGVRRFAADSVAELDMLAAAAPRSQVFVRVRVDDSGSVFQMSAKYGAPIHEAAALVLAAHANGLAPQGLSFHVGSQATRATAWSDAIAAVSSVLSDLLERGIELPVLDLGGGFPIRYPDYDQAPDLTTIAAHIREALRPLPYAPRLFLEPGRGLVATSTSLVAEVIARVERAGTDWLYLDGGTYNALGEAMAHQNGTRYPVAPIRKSAALLQTYVLAGPTGDGLDVITNQAQLPQEIRVGDRLVFGLAGAYTVALASAFNGFPKPSIHVLEPPPVLGDPSDKTVSSRVSIGFPATPASWNKAPAVYGEHKLRIAGHPVMEDWERGYMHRLAEIATSRGGTVLELGYGMGISANAIQARPVESHLVVECHPDVIARAIDDLREPLEEGRVQILGGFWQAVTPLLQPESVDGILFDTYPLREDEIHANHFAFFAEGYRLLKPGGVLTYYSDEASAFSPQHLRALCDAGFTDENIHSEICNVNPPKDCEYWQAKTILAPRIHK
jgi:diaminopimelate decarboxylase